MAILTAPQITEVTVLGSFRAKNVNPDPKGSQIFVKQLPIADRKAYVLEGTILQGDQYFNIKVYDNALINQLAKLHGQDVSATLSSLKEDKPYKNKKGDWVVRASYSKVTNIEPLGASAERVQVPIDVAVLAPVVSLVPDAKESDEAPF